MGPIRVTSIHLVYPGTHHQHIAEMTWLNTATKATGKSTRLQMVQYVASHPDAAYATDGNGRHPAPLVVVNGTPNKYVQTKADGYLTNNLLSLPRY